MLTELQREDSVTERKHDIAVEREGLYLCTVIGVERKFDYGTMRVR
jgi:hypothetical protein